MVRRSALPAVIALASLLLFDASIATAAEVRGSVLNQPSGGPAGQGEIENIGAIRVDMSTGRVTYEAKGSTGPGTESATSGATERVYDSLGPIFAQFEMTGASTRWGDFVQTTRAGVLDAVTFHFTCFRGETLTTARVIVRVYDGANWPTFPAGYPSTLLASYTTPNLTLNMVGGDFGVTQLFTLGNLSAPPNPVLLVPRDLLVTFELAEATPGQIGYTALHRGPSTSASIGSSAPTYFVDQPGGAGVGLFNTPNLGNIAFAIDMSCAGVSQVSPAAVSLAAPFGGSASTPVSLTNTGCADLTFSITNPAYVSLTPTSGTIPPGGTQVLTATVTPTLLRPGFSGFGNVVISSNDPVTPSRTFRIDYTVTGSVAAATPTACYATQVGGGPPRLYRVDLATGAATAIGPTSGVLVPAMAIHPGDGRIFGGIGSGLVNVDAASGALAFIAASDCWSAMTFTPGGGLLKMGCDSTLYAVDPITGAQTARGQVSPFMGGMAVDPTTGLLYGVRKDAGPGTDLLYRIAFPGGATTPIGPLGLGLPIGDITFDQAGRLYGVVGENTAPNQLVSINKTTGQATVIGPTGVQDLSTLAYFAPPATSCRFATSVVAFSSQYTTTLYSAQQALGPPNVYPAYAAREQNWASATPDGQSEFLHLAFSNPAPINYVNVYETYAPGAIRSVRVKNPGTGLLETVWSGTPAAAPAAARIFTAAFPVTPYPVSEVYLDVASELVPGFNEIDAVEIGYRDPLTASQWASSVVGFSSQFSATSWSAQQALGPPDVFPAYADHPNAWASATQDGQREYLELAYTFPSRINFVSVVETFLPGALDKVSVKNPSTGLFEQVWSGTAAPAPPAARIRTISFPQTAFTVSQVRLEFNSPVVPGWNEIDAVGIGNCECPLTLLDSPTRPNVNVPGAGGIEWARPNPFAASTSIGFSLARAGRLEVEVFDLHGKRVARLADGMRSAGRHEIRWDGRDAGGQTVANGMYYLRMRIDGLSDTRKIIKLQ